MNIRGDVARGRRLEVILRVFNFVVAHTSNLTASSSFSASPPSQRRPRRHGSGCHRPGGDGGQARRGRSNASEAGRGGCSRRRPSRRRSRAVTLRPHRRRRRRRVERAGARRRRVERVLFHVRGYRGFERGWEARRGEEARGAGGADAANHSHHPAARGSRGRVLIPRPEAAAAIALTRSSSVTAASSPDTAVRIQASASDLPPPPSSPRVRPSYPRCAGESFPAPRRAPRLQRASRGGSNGRLAVTKLFDNLGDDRGQTPRRRCAHRGRDGANWRGFAAMLRFASENRLASEDTRSPVLGPMRFADSSRISFTASNAPARTFQLGSPISLINFSVIFPEMSARGKPPSAAAATDAPSVPSARTFLVPTIAGPTYGLRANSASSVLSCESLRSARASFSPRPRPACGGAENLASRGLARGVGHGERLLAPRDDE